MCPVYDRIFLSVSQETPVMFLPIVYCPVPLLIKQRLSFRSFANANVLLVLGELMGAANNDSTGGGTDDFVGGFDDDATTLATQTSTVAATTAIARPGSRKTGSTASTSSSW